MKKILMILTFIFLAITMYISKPITAFASEISSPYTLVSGLNFSNNETIVVSNEDSAIIVPTGVTAEIRNISLTFEFENQTFTELDQLFYIESGAKLILDNVNIISNINTKCGVNNFGSLEINNTALPECSVASIVVDSTNPDALLLNEINENDISKIRLLSGYVTVNLDTDISGTIELDTTMCKDKFVGRPVVKGKNTYARFYEDNFNFTMSSTFNSSYPNAKNSKREMFEALVANPQEYFMDYVGDIGDDILSSTSGFAVENNGITHTLKSGDLIMTNMWVKYSENDSDHYIAGKYATANKYIQAYNKCLEIKAYIIDNCAKTSSTVQFNINNLTSLLGTTKAGACSKISESIISSLKINIVTNEDVEERIINIASNSINNFDLYMGEKTFDSCELPNGISQTNNDYGCFKSFKLTASNFYGGTMTINLSEPHPVIPEIPETETINVKLTANEFTYNGQDLKNNIKPYYVIDEQTIYLDEEEFQIVQNEISVILKEQGQYSLLITKQLENVEWNIENNLITVNPKTIIPTYQTEFEYDGSEKKILATINTQDICGNDEVSVLIENKSLTEPGSTTVNVLGTDNPNYSIVEQTLTLMVKKATVNMSGVMFESLQIEYVYGRYNSIKVKNVPQFVKIFRYVNNNQTNVGTYIVSAEFKVRDEYLDKYVLAEEDKVKTATLVITKAKYSSDTIKFEDEEIEYSFSEQKYNIRATGYDDSIIAIDYKDGHFAIGQHVQEITINVINNNYELVGENVKTAVLTIKPISINMSGVTFEPKSATYTGESVSIQVSGVLPTNVSVSYEFKQNDISVTPIDAGDYVAIAKFIVKDNSEYYAEIADMVTTLTITPKEITVALLDNEIEYTGASIVPSVIFSGVCGDDNIGITFVSSTVGKINIGTYTAKVESIDNDNYVLTGETEFEYTIIQATIDMSQIVFNNLTVDYSPKTEHSIYVTNLPECVYVLNYENNGKVNAGTYIVTATFEVKSEYADKYKLAEQDKTKSATLTINKIVIDMSGVTLPDKEVTYSNSVVSAEIQGDLPDGVFVKYSYNSYTNARDIPYTVTATFSLEEQKRENYELSITELSCQIKINRSEYDCNNIIYEDETIEYSFNNEKYIIKATMYVATIVRINYGVGHSEIGSHTQQITISLKNNNYKLVGETTKTAILTIEPITIDMDDVEFKNKTVTYKKGQNSTIAISGNLPENVGVDYEYSLMGNRVDSATNAGEYLVTAKFSVINNTEFYKPISDMFATLTINKSVLNVADFKLENQNVTYNTQPHSLMVSGLTDDIKVEYSDKNIVNAGKYIITANVECVDKINYIFDNGSVGFSLQAELIINKANYDMSKVVFDDAEYTYDGSDKVLTISGELPTGVKLKEYKNNVRKFAGEQTASVSFEISDKENYNIVGDITAILKINKKPLTLSLQKTSFDYTGEVIVLTPILDGVVNGDIVNVSFYSTSIGKINAGNYIAHFKSVDNDNYMVEGNKQFSYVINKAPIDMSNVVFGNVEFTFNNQEYKPKITGLPENVSARIEVNAKKIFNVGTYEVKAIFTTSKNYVTPSPITCSVVVKPSPVIVEFSGTKNLVEDGNAKNIGVRVMSELINNFDDYKIIYSPTVPKLAGVYECSVVLTNNNFVIVGISKTEFEILTPTKVYQDTSMKLTIDGNGFGQSSSVFVTKTDDENKSKLDRLQNPVEKYTSFKIGIEDAEDGANIDVTLNSRDFDFNNVRYLKLYKVNSTTGMLDEISYSILGGQIKFSASLDDEIVIVQYETFTERSTVTIAIIFGLFLLVIVWLFVIVYKRNNRKVVETFITIE